MYLVMGVNCWGLGKTSAAAIKKALEYAPDWGCTGRGRRKTLLVYTVLRFDPEKTTEVYVDDFGRYGWTGERPEVVEDVDNRKEAVAGR